MPTTQRLAPLLAAALALGACDRAVEPYVPGEGVEPPDLSRIFPEGAERSAEREAAAQAPAAAPPERGAPPVTAAAEPLRGTISLAPDLAGRVPAGAILFLIARRGESGPPLAVQRIPDPELPLAFSLGPDDRMIDQMPFAGPLTLSARLDADGNATTRLPGDLQGVAAGTYEPGASGIAIVIDQVL
ncbi:MAG: hypothetical protein OZ948_07925 [Deltaproteobacteria bacterium]|nr:hypothetical protein [Deltaproteobacteria bacterium]